MTPNKLYSWSGGSYANSSSHQIYQNNSPPILHESINLVGIYYMLWGEEIYNSTNKFGWTNSGFDFKSIGKVLEPLH